MKKLFAILLCFVLAASLFACGNKANDSSSSDVSSAEKKAENEDDEKATVDTSIVLDDEKTTINGSGASFSKGTLTISSAGTYSIKGTLSDGNILVDTKDDKKVRLLLDGVTIYSSETAPIFVENSEKETKLVLMKGTVNELSDSADRTTDETNEKYANAVIYSKDDIEITGSGTLNVKANFGKGVFSKNDVQISGGTIEISAVDDGIRGKDSVSVSGGKINVTCGGDGIRTNNEEEKGNIEISGGKVKITSDRDAIQATGSISIVEGTLTLCAGGGSTGDIKSKAPEGRFGGYNGFGNMGGEAETSSSDKESAKGLKAGGSISISGGKLGIDSFDDAFHSDDSVEISDGEIEVSTNDDALHAESSIAISGGALNVSQCLEGLEGETIAVSGGNVVIVSFDDGVNASSEDDVDNGPGGPGNSNASLSISGGKIFINSMGDGVDSNGSIEMTDGLLVVFGPTSDGDTAFDFQANSTVTGGTLLVVGSSGMVEGIGTASAYISSNTSVPGGTLVSISDRNGEELIAFTSPKSISNITFFTEGMNEGDEFTISTGGTHDGEDENGVFLDGKTSGATSVATVVASTTAAGGMGGFGGPGGGPGGPSFGGPGGKP